MNVSSILTLIGLFTSQNCFASFSRTLKFDNLVTVHQFVGDAVIEVSSYVIELPSKLVLIDSQFSRSDALEFLKFTKNLRKPIERIIVTSARLDHHLGADVFKNIAPIYALTETILDITSTAQFVLTNLKQNLQQGIVPTMVTFPTKTLNEGFELIDGVLFSFTKLTKTESNANLIISLPIQKIIFPGDLVSNQVHLYLAEKNFANWINALTVFQKNYNFFSVFLSHGMPTTSVVFQENINYLLFTEEAYSISTTFELFKWRMMTKFFYYKDDNILDLAKDYLYPQK